jgi:hypothetical protein
MLTLTTAVGAHGPDDLPYGKNLHITCDEFNYTWIGIVSILFFDLSLSACAEDARYGYDHYCLLS